MTSVDTAKAPGGAHSTHDDLRALAEALIDAGCDSVELVLAIADLEQLSGELRRLDVDAAEIERQYDAADENARARESSLRFAIGELRRHHDRRLERKEPMDPMTESRLHQLHGQLAAVADELVRAIDAIGDSAIALAAKRDGVEQQLSEVYEAVERVIGANYQRFADDDVVAAAARQAPRMYERLRSEGAR